MRKGFAQIFIIIAVALGIITVVSTGIIISQKLKNEKTAVKENSASKPVNVVNKEATASADTKPATPTAVPVTTKGAPVPSNLSSITIHLYDPFKKSNITTGDFTYRIENTKTKERYESKGPSDWTKSSLPAGSYKLSVYFKDPYANESGKCEGCSNSYFSQTESNMCGWNYDLSAKENPKFTCGLVARDSKYYESLIQPNNGQTAQSGNDTEAPKANFLTPQNGGQMTFKYDGKYCVIMNAPSDNKDSWDKLQMNYQFDSGSWSGWQTPLASICVDNLSNGPHTFQIHYKDTAGNTSSPQMISFTVAI